MVTLKTRLAFNRLHTHFAAEVSGVDLAQPLAQRISREDFHAIWDAINEHQVFVFRNQTFDVASPHRITHQDRNEDTALHHTTMARKSPDGACANLPPPLVA